MENIKENKFLAFWKIAHLNYFDKLIDNYSDD